MKDKGTQLKCSLCKQQYKVSSDPKKHTDRSFCEPCFERVAGLTEVITTNSPAVAVELWPGAVMVASFTGGVEQDCWVEWPGYNGSPGIPRHNQPSRRWVIIHKFPLREYTDDEVTETIWYWLVERVELREAWALHLSRLKKEQDALKQKLMPNEDGEVPEDQANLQSDLGKVTRRIEVGEYRQLLCPGPGEDTDLFRKLVATHREIKRLQLREPRKPLIEQLENEAASIMMQRHKIRMRPMRKLDQDEVGR